MDGDKSQDTVLRKLLALVAYKGLGYQIVKWMRSREDHRARVCEMAGELRASRFRISRSLVGLRNANIVEQSPTGSYRLDSQELPRF